MQPARSRKRKRRAAGQSGGAAPERSARPPTERPEAQGPARRGRSAAKDAEARAALVPLREGERPRAVTIAAVVASLFALATIAPYVAGQKIDGRPVDFRQVAGPGAIMLMASYGLWRSRYWAVLGMQVILGVLIVGAALFLLRASNVLGVIACLAIIVPAGTLFWYLVKALARIQMPERP